jgi:nucleoside-diphosphate-sugar epimerase
LPTILVAGANGLVGRHAAAAFATTPGWRVITAGRRAVPGEIAEVIDEHLTVDLLDPTEALDVATVRPDVTHLVFAAYAARPSAGERSEANVALLSNTLAGFRQSQSLLQHVTLYQGGGAYGGDTGPYKIPARESDPRLPLPNFADEQADLLIESASSDGFRWTVLRPDTVVGYTVGNPMNLLMVLAAYASVCRARGMPLRFPGSEAQYRCLSQVTDAELLGRASVWAASSEGAVDDVFNVTNGDAFRWCDLWPRIAETFGVGLAPPVPFSLVEAMEGNGDVWEWLVNQYDLIPTAWDQVANWSFGDAVLGAGYDKLFSTVKIRQGGFGEAMDSEEQFVRWFDRLAAMKAIPPLGA